MSTHLSRKDLKNDPLVHAEQVGVAYVAEHKGQVIRYTVILLAVVLAVGGYFLYRNRQAETRAEAFRQARRVMTAVVGQPANPPNLSFPSEEEKAKAVEAAYTKLAADYPGTTEGAIAQIYVAAAKVDKGELDAAVSIYRDVIDDAPKPFASTAKLALGQILWGQGKTEEGKKLIQDVIDNPTEFVSSEQASLTLARLQIRSNPEEARKILNTLTQSRSAVSTVAVQLMGQLPQTAN